MKKFILAVLAVLSLSAGIAVAPANAGVGYWSDSGCSGPVYASRFGEIEWYGVSNGAYYWWTYSSAHPNQTYFVKNAIHASWAAGNYECGAAGGPLSEQKECTKGPGNNLSNYIARQQWFENGRYIQRANGDTWYQHHAQAWDCREIQ